MKTKKEILKMSKEELEQQLSDVNKIIDDKINLIRTEYPECGNAIGMLEDIKEKLK